MDCTGVYLDSIAKAPRFSPKEERLLWERMKDGQEARRLLIESQLKAVVNEAGKWKVRAKVQGIPFDDLVQTANAEVVKVVDGLFDPGKGKLGTVLRRCIRRRLGQLVGADDRLVRKPAYFLEGPDPKRPTRSFRREADATDRQTYCVEDCVLRGRESDPAADLDAEDHLEYMRNLFFSRIALLLGDGVSLRDIMLFLDFVWVNHGTTIAKVATAYKISKRRVSDIVYKIRRLLKEVKID